MDDDLLLEAGGIPRGIRNNNPGNIRIGENWQGLVKNPTDASFAQFVSPQYGIRAIVKILLTYNSRGINTIHSIINAWAPTNENDTQSYVKSVSSYVHVGANDRLNYGSLDLWRNLVKAIITHENGQQPYSDDVIDAGIKLASPPIK